MHNLELSELRLCVFRGLQNMVYHTVETVWTELERGVRAKAAN